VHDDFIANLNEAKKSINRKKQTESLQITKNEPQPAFRSSRNQ